MGRPKGSKNKSAVKVVAKRESKCCSEKSEDVSSLTKLALNQVEHANSIKNLEIAVNSLSQGINNLVQNTNKALSEIAKKIQASDSRVSDVEKAVSKEDKPETESESLT